MDPASLRRLIVRVAVSRVVGRLVLVALAVLLGWLGMSGKSHAYGLVAKSGGGSQYCVTFSAYSAYGNEAVGGPFCAATSLGSAQAAAPWIGQQRTAYQNYPYSVRDVVCDGGTCTVRTWSDGCCGTEAKQFVPQLVTAAQTCPQFSSQTIQSGNNCECASGYRGGLGASAGSSCVSYSCPSTSGVATDWGPFGSQSAAAATKYLCSTDPTSTAGGQARTGGCMASGKPDFVYGGGSSWYAEATMSFTGGYCDPQSGGTGSDPTAPALDDYGARDDATPEDKNSCPRGQVLGTVNGAQVCAKAGEASETTKTTTTVNADGSKDVTTTTTTCTGAGSCSTTVTVYHYNVNNVLVGTDVKTSDQSEGSFCAENPGVTLCQKSEFGGVCIAGFSCAGDAVQCAVAKEQHIRNCQLFDTPTALSEVGRLAANGIAQPTGHPGNTVSTVPIVLSSMISSVPLFGSSGGCPSDVTIAGKWVLGFSQMCGSLAVIGVALKALALLVAAFITFRKGV